MTHKSFGTEPRSDFKTKSNFKLRLKLRSKFKCKYPKAVPLAFAYSGNGFTPFDNRLKPENDSNDAGRKSGAARNNNGAAGRKAVRDDIGGARGGSRTDRLTNREDGRENDRGSGRRDAEDIGIDRQPVITAHREKRAAGKAPNTRVRVNRGIVIGAALLLISMIISAVDISMYKSAEAKITEMTCEMIGASESCLPSEFFEANWYNMRLPEEKAAEYEAAYLEFVNSYFGKRSSKGGSDDTGLGLTRDEVIKNYSDYVRSQCIVTLGSVRIGARTGEQPIKCNVVKLAPGRARVTATFVLNTVSKGRGDIPFAFGELSMGVRTTFDGDSGMLSRRLNVVFTAEFSYGIGGTHAEYVNVHKQVYY